jgi:hypothetical protein
VPEALTELRVIESNIVRTCDPVAAEKMIELIEKIRSEGNSVGGVIECVVRGVPPGLGEPVFDKLEADLAKAMLSLPATKGFEIGSGFAGTTMTGLEHNDEFYMDGENVRTRTNRSGGIQGGISNGEEIVFRVAFKPTATVLREQKTVTNTGEDTTLSARGRHDPACCHAPCRWSRRWCISSSPITSCASVRCEADAMRWLVLDPGWGDYRHLRAGQKAVLLIHFYENDVAIGSDAVIVLNCRNPVAARDPEAHGFGLLSLYRCGSRRLEGGEPEDVSGTGRTRGL